MNSIRPVRVILINVVDCKQLEKFQFLVMNAITCRIVFLISSLACLPALIPSECFSQQTTVSISGTVLLPGKLPATGATITLRHNATTDTYVTVAARDGQFHFFNLRPGGPYRLQVSYTGFLPLVSDHNFFSMAGSENNPLTFQLQWAPEILDPTIVKHIPGSPTALQQYQLSRQQLDLFPSVSMNFQDYLRLVPGAKTNGDGMISFGGQNSKYNALHIDGVISNDPLGISASGAIGGQSGVPAIPMEAVEQLHVMTAPYDAQYSQFTGASINAITRSGSDITKFSSWYYFRNRDMSGRSPIAIAANSSGTTRPKLPVFFNQVQGGWISGALVKHKLFYFVALENRFEKRPQPVNLSAYTGNSNTSILDSLQSHLQNRFGYDPGDYQTATDDLSSRQLVASLDWNHSSRQKFRLSYHLSDNNRLIPRPYNTNTVNFSNAGYQLPSVNHAASLEWNRYFKKNSANRLLISFLRELTERVYSGQPFPALSIRDGAGSINIGSHPTSMNNRFSASLFSVTEVYSKTYRKHSFSAGAEFSANWLKDDFVPAFFGTYVFNSANDFISGNYPIRYQRSFSNYVLGNKKYSDAIMTRRFAVFFNDQIQLTSRFTLQAGARLDLYQYPGKSPYDRFYYDTARQIFEKFYPGANSLLQQMPNVLRLSPRIGFRYSLPHSNILIQGGAGLFSGQILNVWATNLHNNNGQSISNINVQPARYNLFFQPNPYQQPFPEEPGGNFFLPKGELNLVDKNYRHPFVFRSSAGITKKTNNGFGFSMDLLFTSNIYENRITNLNIGLPDRRSFGQGYRQLYDAGSQPPAIVLQLPDRNPYAGVFVLSNNTANKGYAYYLTMAINKTFSDSGSIGISYNSGKSFITFEPSGNSVVQADQWRQRESETGKNFVGRSTSDFDPGHRFNVFAQKTFSFASGRMSTTISIIYTGQSGQRFSYVYDSSMINDNGATNGNFDLLYIPTGSELSEMRFIPYNSAAGTIGADQQRNMFEQFIQDDHFLHKRRGEFATRNGARLPFSHTIDLRLQQNFSIRTGNRFLLISLIYDMFNLTNLLNRRWGHIYSLNFDNYPVLRFAGFEDAGATVPVFQFRPVAGNKYPINQGAVSGSSSRWISQLGIKLSLP